MAFSSSARTGYTEVEVVSRAKEVDRKPRENDRIARRNLAAES